MSIYSNENWRGSKFNDIYSVCSQPMAKADVKKLTKWKNSETIHWECINRNLKATSQLSRFIESFQRFFVLLFHWSNSFLHRFLHNEFPLFGSFHLPFIWRWKFSNRSHSFQTKHIQLRSFGAHRFSLSQFNSIIFSWYYPTMGLAMESKW